MRKRVIVLSVVMGFILTGCASMSKQALNTVDSMPNEKGYEVFSRSVTMDAKMVDNKLRQMKSMVEYNNKTKRGRNISAYAKGVISSSKRYLGNGGGNLGQNMKAMDLARYAQASAIYVEPSEVSAMEDTMSNPLYKKVSVEMQEYDIIDGCKNPIKKFFTGFERRYLYFGALKESNGWKFYVSYPKLEIQKASPGDDMAHCRAYYIGPEAHAKVLSDVLKAFVRDL